MAARKAGSIIPRGPNRHLIRWYIGRGPDGKRRYASRTIQGTYSQAQKALGKETHDVAQGSYVAPAKQTLGDYVSSWLRDVAATEVKEATLKSYTVRVKVDVIDRIGGLRLDKVTPQVLQSLYSDLSKRGLSPRTVRYTHTILNSALKKAVAWKVLRDNPCQHVALPKAQHLEMDVWSVEEVNRFLSATQDTRDHCLWYTLLNTGMRPGEAFGLKWEDLEGDRLRIQRAVAETLDQGVYTLEAPKTERSKRSVAISQDHVALLQGHRRRQIEEILAAGTNYTRQDFIFADPEGHHEFTERVRGRWKTAVRRAGVRKIRLYDCRHTHATLLLKAGINPKVVSERLGHASIVITLDTYSHVLPDMQDEAVERLQAILKAAR
jgi:integrase